jgi:hypothetical protein
VVGQKDVDLESSGKYIQGINGELHSLLDKVQS